MGWEDPRPRNLPAHMLTRAQLSRMKRYLREEPGPLDTPCLIWHGAVRKGYGLYLHKRAHKVWWEHHNGPVPPNMDLAHECSVKLCVRHVRPLTHQENMQEDSGKTLLTECPRCGLDLTKEENVYRQPSRPSNRQCKRCRRRRNREAYRRERGGA